MKLLLCVVSLLILLSGCATTTPTSVGDGWFAVMDDTKHTTIHVKQLAPLTTKYNNTHIVNLDRWAVRVDNSGNTPMCVRLHIMYIDYFVDIPSNWFLVKGNTTQPIGTLTQDPLILLDGVEALGDSVWKIDTMETLPYVENRGCEFVINND